MWGEPDGDVFWAIHEYIDGHIYSWEEWWKLKQDDDFLFNLGAEIAGLHDSLSSISPTGDPRLSYFLPPIQFSFLHEIRMQWENDLDELCQSHSLDNRYARATLIARREEIAGYWRILESTVAEDRICHLPLQIVHGDISPVNTVFSRQQFTLIDWDCIRYGFRLYDALGDVLIRRPASDNRYPAFNLAEVLRYIDGYQHGTERPVSNAELRAVPLFCLARQLEDLRQRVAVMPQISATEDPTYSALIESRIQSMCEISRCCGLYR
jgi:Ser/Thr protein kinase RdoA (MazF antagonist)